MAQSSIISIYIYAFSIVFSTDLNTICGGMYVYVPVHIYNSARRVCCVKTSVDFGIDLNENGSWAC